MTVLSLLIRKSLFSTRRQNREGLFLIVLSLSVGIASIIVVISIMNEMQSQIKLSLISIESYDSVFYHKKGIDTDISKTYDSLQSKLNVSTMTAFADEAVYVASPLTEAVMQLRVLDYDKANQDQELLDALNITAFDKGAIVVGALLAQELQVWHGDVVTLSFVAQGRGYIPQQYDLFIYDIFYNGSLYDTAWGFMDIDHYRELLGEYPRNMSVGIRHDSLLDKSSIQELGSLRTWQENNNAFYYALRVEKIMISLLLAIMFCVVVLHYYFVQWRRVFNKQKDIVALRSLGYTQNSVRLWFLFETVIIGLLSVAMGTALGFVIMRYRADILILVVKLFGYRFSIDFGTKFYFSIRELIVLVGGVMGALFCVSIFASRRISSMSSVEFFREFS